MLRIIDKLGLGCVLDGPSPYRCIRSLTCLDLAWPGWPKLVVNRRGVGGSYCLTWLIADKEVRKPKPMRMHGLQPPQQPEVYVRGHRDSDSISFSFFIQQ